MTRATRTAIVVFTLIAALFALAASIADFIAHHWLLGVLMLLLTLVDLGLAHVDSKFPITNE